VLAWHVDYWDGLGWKDRFGSKYATQRQERYRRVLDQRSLLTPQPYAGNRPTPLERIAAVVEGAAARTPLLDARIDPRFASGKVRVEVELSRVARAEEEGGPAEGAEVRVVLYARRATTEVPRGENAGKTLTDVFAVCDVADPVAASRAVGRAFEVKLSVPRGIAREDLGVAVLVEDPETMTTLACWQADLPEPERAR